MAKNKNDLQDINNPMVDDEQEDNTQEETGYKVNSVPHTQGKKGQKMQRINMAFQDDVIAYLQAISRVAGGSMTDYVNKLISKDMESNKDFVKQQAELQKNFMQANR